MWGSGVTSSIETILSPSPFNALRAESLPGPGPLTLTKISFKPNSLAFVPAFSAATCAAKGVRFLAPLNPDPPAVAQAIAFPALSVIVIIVLLKVA